MYTYLSVGDQVTSPTLMIVLDEGVDNFLQGIADHVCSRT
jgi:hypothetical protein